MKKNLAESVRARLLNLAKKQDGDFNQILVRFALERILYCRVERHSVLTGHAGDIMEGLADGFQIARTEPKEIGISRRAVGQAVPEVEEQRSLEHESIAVFRPPRHGEKLLLLEGCFSQRRGVKTQGRRIERESTEGRALPARSPS